VTQDRLLMSTWLCRLLELDCRRLPLAPPALVGMLHKQLCIQLVVQSARWDDVYKLFVDRDMNESIDLCGCGVDPTVYGDGVQNASPTWCMATTELTRVQTSCDHTRCIRSALQYGRAEVLHGYIQRDTVCAASLKRLTLIIHMCDFAYGLDKLILPLVGGC
jgi:hypothetical protein